MKNFFIITALAVFAGLVWLSVRVSREGFAEPARARREKRFSTEVAEGVRFRDFQTHGIDLLAFTSCRVEKLRRGAVTFGAFNVLVLENVVVNLPPEGAAAGNNETPEAGGSSQPAETDAADFISLFKSLQGLTHIQFSGMRIHGLEINRHLEDGQTAWRFAAELAEGGVGIGEHIRLSGCVVYAPDGAVARAGAARIEIKPRPTLVYTKDGAEQRLPL